MKLSKNEFNVGIMVIICVILFTGILIVVGNYQEILKPKKIIKVYFQDVKGLKTGDPIFYAGVKAGAVEDMKFYTQKKEGKNITVVEILCKVKRSVYIREDSKATIVSTLTGVTSLVIKPGNGTRKKEEVIYGKPPMELSELTSAGGDVLDKVNMLLSHLNNIFGRMDEKKDIDDIMENLKVSAAELRDLLKDSKEIISSNKTKINKTITNISELSEKANKFISENSDTVGGVITDLSESIKIVSRILKEKEEDIKGLLTNLNTAGTKLNKTLDALNSLIADNRGDVDEIIDNALKISKNMKALSSEIRQRPWRLLHKPKKKELKQITIYDVSKTMAEQAEDISTAVSRLKNMESSPEKDALIKSLNENLKNYQKMEEIFWKLLEEQDNK